MRPILSEIEARVGLSKINPTAANIEPNLGSLMDIAHNKPKEIQHVNQHQKYNGQNHGEQLPSNKANGKKS